MFWTVPDEPYMTEKPALRDGARGGGEHGADLALQVCPGGGGDGLGGVRDAFGGQPNRADAQAVQELIVLRVADDQFRGAAADVHEQRALAGRQFDAAGDAQIDQPRFFLAGDDAHIQIGQLADALDELIAVLGFAHGGGGEGDDLFRPEAPRDFGEPRADQRAARDGGFGQAMRGRRRCRRVLRLGASAGNSPSPSRTTCFCAASVVHVPPGWTSTTASRTELVPMSMRGEDLHKALLYPNLGPR